MRLILSHGAVTMVSHNLAQEENNMKQADFDQIVKDELTYNLLVNIPPNLAVTKTIPPYEEGKSLTISRKNGATHLIAESTGGSSSELVLDISEAQILKLIADEKHKVDINALFSMPHLQ